MVVYGLTGYTLCLAALAFVNGFFLHKTTEGRASRLEYIKHKDSSLVTSQDDSPGIMDAELNLPSQIVKSSQTRRITSCGRCLSFRKMVPLLASHNRHKMVRSTEGQVAAS
jgi:hypothetical protein